MTHWDQFWSQDGNQDWWKVPAPQVLELLASLSPASHPMILDLGCGLGRHSIPFAQAGFIVTALDTSLSAIQFLQASARQLNLDIGLLVGDFLHPGLHRNKFDLVLSYNVLYHGYREQLALGIHNAYQLLKSGGLFYFTCPSRQDGKYGFGLETAPHTYLSTKSILPGDMHYFCDQADIDELLAGFRLVSRTTDEGYFDNRGQQQFYSNWLVLAQKEN